jgi:crotonobetainyl-CoA:carnitine CoA-transferase CaiB-like acyl-CoA transferase
MAQNIPASKPRASDDDRKLVVVDLGVGMAAAMASRLLADLGADVFRIDCDPTLGEHTDEILTELGVVPEKIAELRRSGAIG